MVKAVWVSFGDENMPPELRQRYARKVRELVSLYVHALAGPFAIYCQTLFNAHRQAFWDADGLEEWKK